MVNFVVFLLWHGSTLALSVNMKNKQIVHRVFVNINLHRIASLHVYGYYTQALGTQLMVIDGRLGLKTIILFHPCHHWHDKDFHSIKLSGLLKSVIKVAEGRKKIPRTNLTRRTRTFMPLWPIYLIDDFVYKLWL